MSTVHLVDSSVWVALSIDKHEHHETALGWLNTVVEPASVLFCRATQQTFLRLITTAAVVASYGYQPKTNRQAWSEYETILADRRIAFREREPAGLEDYWRQFANRDRPSPNLWMDAYLAAFARAGGYQMVTTDAGFSQFDGLDLVLLGSSRN
jgi:toxin-antitoxin system PIN domain toxin